MSPGMYGRRAVDITDDEILQEICALRTVGDKDVFPWLIQIRSFGQIISTPDDLTCVIQATREKLRLNDSVVSESVEARLAKMANDSDISATIREALGHVLIARDIEKALLRRLKGIPR